MPWLASHADTTIYIDGVASGSTAADGSFVVQDIAPGTHTVEARHLGYLSSSRDVEVAGGQRGNIGETLLVAGDAQPDNAIDLEDVLLVEAVFGLCDGDSRFEPTADANQSGCIDAFDVAAVLDGLGRVGPTRWWAGP